MPRRYRPSETNIPDTMNAAAVERFGPPSLLKLHRVPVPHPEPQEILIALDTAGVGSWDASIRDGSWRRTGTPKFPLVPGTDGAGTVVGTGSRVKRFRPGDRVYAYEFGNRHGGFYAQYVVVRADRAAHIPKALGLRDAGAVATTGLTALQGIMALGIRRGRTVLIFGASGAVGTMAVQFAANRGAIVIATATGRAAARLVRSLGAAAVADVRTEKGFDRLRAAAPAGVDGIFALAGGEELERCLDFVRPRGQLIHPNGVEPLPRPRKGIRIRGFDAVSSPRQFARLNRQFNEHRMHVPIAATYPLAHASRAHCRLDDGQVLGRIVLRIRWSSQSPLTD